MKRNNSINHTPMVLNKMKIFSIICVLGLFSSLYPAGVNDATISGFVFDKADGEVLIGVNVYLDETVLGGGTNLSGYYVIPAIPPGTYKLVCSHIGYKSFYKTVTLKAKQELRLNIELGEDLIETETIVVSADSIPLAQRLYNQSVSEITITPIEIQRIPQVAEADLLRSLQTLPGVLPLSDYSSALYIRGGTPDQNLYLLDGTDVYNPEHAFGLFSTFNTEAIKQVELYKGGFGAEYGGRLSSILNITNLDGNQEEFEGSASISLLSAKTTLQMPIGNIGSISGSLRRTYFDKTIGPSIDEVPEYFFYDGNLKAFFNIDANNKFTISTYGGRDVLDFTFNDKSPDKVGLQYDWGNKTISTRWTRVFTPKLFANFWVTGSRFSSDFELEELNLVERNLVTDITFKGNLEYRPASDIGFKFGFEQKNLHVLYRQTWDDGKVNVENRPEHYIGYVQTFWKPDPRWDIELGLRLNRFVSDTTFINISPRLTAKYKLSEKSNLKFATGMYSQYLHRIPRFFVTDIWAVSNQYQKESQAIHYVLGYQREIKKDYHVEVELFHKKYMNLHAFNHNFGTQLYVKERDSQGNPVYTESRGLFHEGDGNTNGFEVLFRKTGGLVTGWLGYSYSRTKYKMENVNGERSFFPRHDRAQTLNVVGNFDIRNALRRMKGKSSKAYSSKFFLGLNFVYSSGQPFTEPGSGYIIGSAPNAPIKYVEYAPTMINNIRFPAYARMDLSLTYQKQFKNWLLAPYLQVYNVGNRKNVWFPVYEYSNGVPDVDEINMFPILPTIGVNITF